MWLRVKCRSIYTLTAVYLHLIHSLKGHLKLRSTQLVTLEMCNFFHLFHTTSKRTQKKQIKQGDSGHWTVVKMDDTKGVSDPEAFKLDHWTICCLFSWFCPKKCAPFYPALFLHFLLLLSPLAQGTSFRKRIADSKLGTISDTSTKPRGNRRKLPCRHDLSVE